MWNPENLSKGYLGHHALIRIGYVCVRVGPQDNAAAVARAANMAEAAPEMLAALKMAVRFLDHPEVIAIPFAGNVVELARQIKATIDKAEGRESQEVNMKKN